MERSSQLESVGRALRLLRMRRGRKQYTVAQSAGITKAMLSAYETGKRLPSLATLGALLDALGADLGDLHRALIADRREDEMFGGAPPEEPRPAGPRAADGDLYPDPREAPAGEIGEAPDVYRILGVRSALSPGQERAFAEMLHGFHLLMRYLHRRIGDLG